MLIANLSIWNIDRRILQCNPHQSYKAITNDIFFQKKKTVALLGECIHLCNKIRFMGCAG